MNVSVVIPAYNVEGWIGQTVASVLEQRVKPMEVIVVDDGSTDATADVVRATSREVRVVTQPNRGQAAARNRGAAEAAGDVLLFLDADDVLLPPAIQVVGDAMERWGEAGAVNPRFRALGSDGEATAVQATERPERYGRSDLRRVLLRNPFGGNMAVRRSVWEQHRYPESRELRFCEDLALWIELLLEDVRILVPPQTLVLRREDRLGSATGQLMAMRLGRNTLFRRLSRDARLTRRERAVCRYQVLRTAAGVGLLAGTGCSSEADPSE